MNEQELLVKLLESQARIEEKLGEITEYINHLKKVEETRRRLFYEPRDEEEEEE